jgi:hypothetical protein
MRHLNRALKGLFNFFLVFAGLLTVLCLYQLLAVKHGLLPAMSESEITQDLMIFNVMATIPIITLLSWPLVSQRWPEAYLAAIRFRGTRYLIVLTRWRAGLIASLVSLFLIDLTL